MLLRTSLYYLQVIQGNNEIPGAYTEQIKNNRKVIYCCGISLTYYKDVWNIVRNEDIVNWDNSSKGKNRSSRR